MKHHVFPWSTIAAVVAVLSLSHIAMGQSMARDTLETWDGQDLAKTFDHPFIENSGHVNNAPANESDAQVFSWDSYGRVRIDRQNPDSPFVAYRILTIDAGTDSRIIKSTMDEFDFALGLHLGEVAGWKMGTVLGVGYSSTHPFVNTSGLFGIGHITAEHALGEKDSLVLAVDYEGNSALLPDVPLPGFALMHHEPQIDSMLGFPMSKVVWRPTPPLEITAQYTVPYTADVDVEYRLAKHVGLYADAGNFFQGFVVARGDGVRSGDITNRQFSQIRRTEVGVRFIFGKLIDASIGVGYAFDQGFSSGFDVRDMKGTAHISNEPYLALVLRGTF